MKAQVKAGTTSYICEIFIQDTSSTTGAGLTGMVYNSAGLTAYYKRSNGTTAVQITLATIATLGTFASGGFKEVDATNMPGVYELHIPDACLAAGATSVAILLKGAVNMAPVPLEITLKGNDEADIMSRLGAPAGASIAADVAAVKSDSAAILDDTGTSGVVVAAGSKSGYQLDLSQALPGTPVAGSVGQALKDADTQLDAAISSRLAASSYTSPDNSGISAIKAQTDKISFAGTGPYDVKATLDGETVTVATNNDKAGYALTAAYDPAKSAASQTSVNTISAVTGKLDPALELDGAVYRFTANALEMAPSGGGGGGATAAEIWSYATRKLTSALTDEGTPRDMAGTGAADPAAIWSYSSRTLTSVPFVLPPLTGTVYATITAQNQEVPIIRGDTPTVPFNLGSNFTGWTPKFAVKAELADVTYLVAIKDAVWTDAATGQGYVSLTAAETRALPNRSYGEIELQNGAQRLTVIKFVLKSSEDVIK